MLVTAPKHTDVFTPSKDTARALRDAFGRFGTGVTIVTTRTPHGPVGMTANSFSSVSLDPALVLWSPALNSKRFPAFEQATDFCIHILSDDQGALAQHFAGRGDGFDTFETTESTSGVPVLEGCLAVFHCRTHAIHPAGDHAIILGAVQEVYLDRAKGPGLMFEGSRFGRFVPSETQ